MFEMKGKMWIIILGVVVVLLIVFFIKSSQTDLSDFPTNSCEVDEDCVLAVDPYSCCINYHPPMSKSDADKKGLVAYDSTINYSSYPKKEDCSLARCNATLYIGEFRAVCKNNKCSSELIEN